MQIDSFTVVLFGIFIKLVLGCLFLVFWHQHRSAVWYAWWSSTFFFAAVAAIIFITRGFAAELLSIGIGDVFIVAAFASCWQGARAFDRRPILWWPVIAAPSAWFVACLLPGFVENVAYRVVLSSIIISFLLALAAFEFWRGRDEQLPSRWPVIVLCSSFALFFAVRIPLIGLLPFPFGALPMQPGAVGAFNLIMFFHTLLLTVLIVAMSKERLELDQRVKAQTDPLTGALNRRALLTRGARLLQRHQMRVHRFACCFWIWIDSSRSTTASGIRAAMTC